MFGLNLLFPMGALDSRTIIIEPVQEESNVTRIAVVGTAGRMGRMFVEAIAADDRCQLTVAIERPGSRLLGVDAGELVGVGDLGVALSDDLAAVADRFDVVINFTNPDLTMNNVELCRQHGKGIVIGTTGLSDEQKQAMAGSG